MPTDYNDARRIEIEKEYDLADRQQDAVIAIDSEIETLLENNGFGTLYNAITDTTAYDDTLYALAKARHPHLFS